MAETPPFAVARGAGASRRVEPGPARGTPRCSACVRPIGAGDDFLDVPQSFPRRLVQIVRNAQTSLLDGPFRGVLFQTVEVIEDGRNRSYFLGVGHAENLKPGRGTPPLRLCTIGTYRTGRRQ